MHFLYPLSLSLFSLQPQEYCDNTLYIVQKTRKNVFGFSFVNPGFLLIYEKIELFFKKLPKTKKNEVTGKYHTEPTIWSPEKKQRERKGKIKMKINKHALALGEEWQRPPSSKNRTALADSGRSGRHVAIAPRGELHYFHCLFYRPLISAYPCFIIIKNYGVMFYWQFCVL